MPLNLFVRITPKPQHFQDAKAAILSILKQTRDEEGCVQFTLLEEKECLFLFEEWKSQEALDLHHRQTYTAAIFEQYQDWLARPIELTRMSRIET